MAMQHAFAKKTTLIGLVMHEAQFLWWSAHSWQYATVISKHFFLLILPRGDNSGFKRPATSDTPTQQHDSHHEDGSDGHGFAEIHAGNAQKQPNALKEEKIFLTV